MSDYIPDLTERYPEGFREVSSTYDKYYNGWLYEDDDIPEPEPIKPKKFETGGEFRIVGVFGGVTYYKVKEIDREKWKILLSEKWEDVDGHGTRPAEWHKLETAEDGVERAFLYDLKEYGEWWIYADNRY